MTSTGKKILVIDDDVYISNLLSKFLEKKGYQTQVAHTGKKGVQMIKGMDFDLILCDYRLPDMNGMEILKYSIRNNPSAPVIIITAYADVNMAVQLIKAGARDYVTKPIQPEEILDLIEKSLITKTPEASFLDFEQDFITGDSPQIKQVLEYVRVVAPTEMTVFIQGETGSGKEYIARAIHHNSRRKNKPFVAVDCGAIPRELANSELFGHVKGAFTGALYDKKGLFQEADRGTLFLDEIGNLGHENQVKILRALQERIINRVGENKNIPVDVRVIVATNEDLYREVRQGNLREDLYHRVNEFKINLPPLRERGNDVLIFAEKFIERANKRFNKSVRSVDGQVKKILLNHPWPGNIRELENVIKRCVLLSKNNTITADLLPGEIRTPGLRPLGRTKGMVSGESSLELKGAAVEAEKQVIMNALSQANNNKSKAAKLLKIDRKTLYNKLKQFEIDPG